MQYKMQVSIIKRKRNLRIYLRLYGFSSKFAGVQRFLASECSPITSALGHPLSLRNYCMFSGQEQVADIIYPCCYQGRLFGWVSSLPTKRPRMRGGEACPRRRHSVCQTDGLRDISMTQPPYRSAGVLGTRTLNAVASGS